MSPYDDLIQALRSLGLVRDDETPKLTALDGGVSGDVYRLEAARGLFCVKRALPALRVAGDWRAPVERSHFEVEWLKIAGEIGICVPEVVAEDRLRHLFVMPYLDPKAHPVWKAQLGRGHVDLDVARSVGTSIGKVHATTAYSSAVAARFQSGALFEALRLDPYLRTTGLAHPDLAPSLNGLADRMAVARIALVHGDVSPKNILVGPEGPVILDAECAWFGDPAFDVAFVCAHLLLKAVWRPQDKVSYRSALGELMSAYRVHVAWEGLEGLEARAAQTLAALLLARVDGKSPVEYLTEPADKAFVRRTARLMVIAPLPRVEAVADRWMEALESR